MGWQVRSSGGKYGSSTGHALLIGARSKKVLDSIVFNKKCGLCTKHERKHGTLTNVRRHVCVKNYEGSSKAMEAAALVKMLSRIAEEKGVSICTVISDDDSNARAKARHVSNGGLLPLTVEEPRFLADPSHRKRVFARAIYNLSNLSAKISTVNKGLAAHLKYCYGACVKRYRHLSSEELSKKVYNILEHICDNHGGCHESWCYNKRATAENKTYLAPRDHRINKTKETPAYEQLKKIFDQYANISQMAYCNHPFDTQTNEALNQAIANVAPKSVCYSSTVSLNARIALVIGIHNMGHLPFFTTYMRAVGVDMGRILTDFLRKKQDRKEQKRNYQKRVTSKVKRSRQQQKQREQVFQERTDKSYGTGIGLTAGMPKKRKAEDDIGTVKECKCGSSSHKRTTHRDCPLRKGSVKPREVSVGVTSLTPRTPQISSSLTHGESDSDEDMVDDGYESERTVAIRKLVNMLSLNSFDDSSDESD
jgi:hypothetical protein